MARRRRRSPQRRAPASKWTDEGEPSPGASSAPARQVKSGQPDQPDPLRYATVPLRLFLGVTFLYAGLQKFSDPGFLSPGSSTFIGTQLHGYAIHSPIGFLITGVAMPLAVPVGVAVMLTEIAVGLMTVLGIYTRWAATVGSLLSAVLFLTASWSVQPYFLGSDSIYTVAWVTLALTGDLGVLSLQGRLRPRAPEVPVDMSRRRFMLQLGSFGVAAVWLLAVLPRSGPAPAGSAQNPPPSSTPAPTPSADASPTSSPGATSPPASGKLVGSLNQIRTNGGSLEYQDPKSGDPAVLVDLGGSQVVAFDAVCTHAGCTVQYQASDRQLICPCHGAVFDAAHDAQVLGGPAPTPLTKLRITVQPNGDVHAA